MVAGTKQAWFSAERWLVNRRGFFVSLRMTAGQNGGAQKDPTTLKLRRAGGLTRLKCGVQALLSDKSGIAMTCI